MARSSPSSQGHENTAVTSILHCQMIAKGAHRHHLREERYKTCISISAPLAESRLANERLPHTCNSMDKSQTM